jgi:hypothetical protein
MVFQGLEISFHLLKAKQAPPAIIDPIDMPIAIHILPKGYNVRYAGIASPHLYHLNRQKRSSQNTIKNNVVTTSSSDPYVTGAANV